MLRSTALSPIGRASHRLHGCHLVRRLTTIADRAGYVSHTNALLLTSRRLCKNYSGTNNKILTFHQRRTLLHDAIGPLINTLPPILIPPVVFFGLLVALWVQKCILMVIFQNKIIYMPSLPPNSRYETIADYDRQCRGVAWEEKHIRSLDGTQIALCIGHVPQPSTQALPRTDLKTTTDTKTKTHVVIVYFQGNGSSTPPRLPHLSRLLRTLDAPNPNSSPNPNPNPATHSLIALSYRGYWTSRGRPSQRGIERDAEATLAWVRDTYAPSLAKGADVDVRVVLWGQSIGAGVVADAAARWFKGLDGDRASALEAGTLSGTSAPSTSSTLSTPPTTSSPSTPSPLPSSQEQEQEYCPTAPTFAPGRTTPNISVHLTALILETPFVSIRAMLAALYPQRWVPYKHLWPFLRNWWDTGAALRALAGGLGTVKEGAGEGRTEGGSESGGQGQAANNSAANSASGSRLPNPDIRTPSAPITPTNPHPPRHPHPLNILILAAGNDEVVPPAQAEELWALGTELGLRVERVVVGRALHHEASTKGEGMRALVGFVRGL